MNTYIGSKMVNAAPMSQAAYSHFRSQPIPEGVYGCAEGFLIEDPKGPANTLSYKGEMNWLPRLQFEAEYLDLGNLKGQSREIQQIKADLAQLQTKMDQMRLFISSDKFLRHTFRERELMLEQSRVMTRYVFILEDRIYS